jgi:hypothetical protein
MAFQSPETRKADAKLMSLAIKAEEAAPHRKNINAGKYRARYWYDM